MGSKEFLIEVEGTADAAFAIDSGGQITAWNNAAAELFGLSEADVIGTPCDEILQGCDDEGISCSVRCIVERAVRDNRSLHSFDLRVKTKRGRQWCNVSVLMASETASGARHAIHIVRPRELRKRLEQALSEFVRTQARNGLDNSPARSATPKPGINGHLTSREVEVLKRLARGHSTRAIANQLNISSATVNNHIKHILTKFGAHTRLEAIRHAESVGVI